MSEEKAAPLSAVNTPVIAAHSTFITFVTPKPSAFLLHFFDLSYGMNKPVRRVNDGCDSSMSIIRDWKQ